VARRRIGRGSRKEEEEGGEGWVWISRALGLSNDSDHQGASLCYGRPPTTYSFTHTYLLDTVRKDEKNQSVSVYL
jgi:hypothetical protein